MAIHLVNKPLNLTSFDVVARARKFLNTRKIGHTGTLDPLATGVLVLCSDASTKLVQFLTADSKDYLALVALGGTSPTLDAEGPLQEPVQTHFALPPRDTLERALEKLRGPQLQMPPQYSAISVDGKRAYEVARAGGETELKLRPITIFSLELLAACASIEEAQSFVASTFPYGNSFPPALGTFPTLVLKASVSSGTYLRSLARDLGDVLGVPAHLAGLIRTRVGKFSLAEAVALPEVKSSSISELSALDYPHLEADPVLALHLRQGKRPPTALEGRFEITENGNLLAIADAAEGFWTVVRGW